MIMQNSSKSNDPLEAAVVTLMPLHGVHRYLLLH